MTAKFPTLSADPAPRPEPEAPSSRETFGASGAPDDFSGLIFQALNRHTAQRSTRDGISRDEFAPPAQRPAAKNSRATGSKPGCRPDEPGSTRDSSRADRKTSSREADSNTDHADTLAAANAATAVAQAPAPPPASKEGTTMSADNSPTAPGQDGASPTPGAPGGTVAVQPGLSAEPAVRADPAAGLTPTAPTATELVDLQKAAQNAIPTEAGQNGGGIPAAQLREQMKSTAETDEIAGSAMQKLPRPAARDDQSTDSRPKSNGQSASPTRSEPPTPTSLSALADKFNPALAWKTEAPAAALLNNDPSTRVERVSELVNREAVILRQSGAATLAVSLKVDSRTELFLQLTNHDGQIQASIRFERGEVAGLDRHWGQLQESLARQNVQLLPLEQKAGANGFQSPSGQTASRQSDSPPDQPREHGREPREQTAASETGAKPNRNRNRQNKTSGRSGWETWA